MAIVHKAKPLGGVSLNYEVVGGTTAPTTFKKENTIWVNTDMELCEHEFSYVHSGILKDANKTGKATSTTMFHATSTSLTTQNDAKTAFFECLPNTRYRISKSVGNLWYIATTQDAPAVGVPISILNATVDSSTTIDIVTGSNANYLVVFVSNAYEEADITVTCLDTIDTRADGSDLQNGDVWIQTDIDKASVSFNAIKRNELMVYPYKLKQWDGSAWKHRDVCVYTKETSKYLPNELLLYADTMSDVTGGYTIGNIGGNAYYQGWSDAENAWVMRYSGHNWWGAGWMQTNNMIDVTGYSTIRLTGSSYRGYGAADKGRGYVYIALVSEVSGSGDNASGYCGSAPDKLTVASGYQTPIKYVENLYGDDTITLDLDVSDIEGSYYIQIGRYNETGYYTFSSLFQTLTLIG